MTNVELFKGRLIWSKGPFINSYSKKGSETRSKERDIIDLIENVDNIIWIRNSGTKRCKDLDKFSFHIDKLKNPVILITTDGDRPIPSSYNKDVVTTILNSDKILSWYTQNYDQSMFHPKLKHFPIGFDFHTSKWLINNSIDEKISFMLQCRNLFNTNERISNKILSDTHHSISHSDRKILYNTLKNNTNIIFTDKRYPFIEITKEYNKYNFVLSPRGKGLDCHRTWELLLAGVIIITKTSSLNEMYINNQLPVVIIEDWDDLNHDLDIKLKNWYDQYIQFTRLDNIYPKLLFDYWIK